MPDVARLRKTKRATVVIKKTHAFTTYPKCYKSYKPLYEKIKVNNRHLAKALSKEKLENNLLFKRNVSLEAENQELVRSCRKRDRVMTTMLADAKSMINMLVTATGYLTNYISSCQEFTSRMAPEVRLSCNSNGRRESSRRLSTKSPARGIVKPMVSGHTITKPTISLRRVNMQHINPPTTLSSITESPDTPSRSETANESILPDTPPSVRQNHNENRQMYRLPERLTVASPRIGEKNEHRLRRRQSKRSERLSGRRAHSRSTSGRFSETQNTSPLTETAETIDNPLTEIAETIDNPLIKLKDVSKLLKNSPRVNIRLLNKMDFATTESTEDSDDINNTCNNDVVIPETEVSINISNENINDCIVSNDKNYYKESANHSHDNNHDKNKKHSNTSNFDDPLEGPSWLLENHCSSKRKESAGTSKQAIYNLNSTNGTSKSARYSKTQEDSDVSLPSPGNLTFSGKRCHDSNEANDDSDDEENKENNFCAMIQPSHKFPCNHNADDEEVTTFSRFITRRRRRPTIDDEDSDDFTLMIARRPQQRQEFNINDLRLPEIPTMESQSEDVRRNPQRLSDLTDLELPALERSNIVPTLATEIEPEITATIQKRLQNCTMTSFNNSMTENMGRTTIYNIMYNDETIKLPKLTDESFYKEAISETRKKSLVQKNNEGRTADLSDGMEDTVHKSMYKKKAKQEKKRSGNKDPSSAKVVLQKLNQMHVKQQSPLPESLNSGETAHSQRSSALKKGSLTVENSSDSDCSTSNKHERPRRRKAPTNLREPSLNKKLRRDT